MSRSWLSAENAGVSTMGSNGRVKPALCRWALLLFVAAVFCCVGCGTDSQAGGGDAGATDASALDSGSSALDALGDDVAQPADAQDVSPRRDVDGPDVPDIPAPPRASIAVSAQELDFGAVRLGEIAVRELVVSHDGSEATLQIEAPTLSADSSGDFRVVSSASAELQPGENVTITVEYTPRDGEADAGRLVIAHDIPGLAAVEVALVAAPQQAAICFTPGEIMFGELDSSAEANFQFIFVNCGTYPTRVVDVSLSPMTSRDFSLPIVPSLPTDLPLDGEETVWISYSPSGGGPDSGTVVVQYEAPDGGPLWESVNVTGSERTGARPVLDIGADALAFGEVGRAVVRQQTLILRNIGDGPLLLESVGLAEGGYLGLELLSGPADAALVQPGDSRDVVVSLTVGAPLPSSDFVLGHVVVLSSDIERRRVAVPITATATGPWFAVEPADGIAFGVVPIGDERETLLTLGNYGVEPVELLGLEVTQEMAVSGTSFGYDTPTGMAPALSGGIGRLDPGQQATMLVRFSNETVEEGTAFGTLRLRSDDPGAGELRVALMADASDGGPIPVDSLRLTPVTNDLGIVGEGESAQSTFTLENVGTIPRDVTDIRIYACESGGGFWGWGGTSCDTETASPYFSVVSPVDLSNLVVPAHGALEIVVEFTGGLAPDDPRRTERYEARLQVEVQGSAGDIVVLPDPERYRENLTAQVGVVRAYLDPPAVDFGPVAVGCRSETELLSVWPTGDVPLRVTEIDAGACGDIFELIGVPEIPEEGLLLEGGASLGFMAALAPSAVGPADCDIIVRTNACEGAEMRFALSGEGVVEPLVVEQFVHDSAPAVDVLFVIDDSGSMCEEQTRLAANFEAFIQRALEWGNNFHLGVVTTCVHDEAVCGGVGRLVSEFAPDERWAENDTWRHFLDNVMVGCNGNSDVQEAGLEAAYAALSAPNATLVDGVCEDDDTCESSLICLPDLNQCGGTNGGFLRPGAALEIIILSDEEDQSPEDTDFYARFFRSFLDYYGKTGARVHAIVGDEGTGCQSQSQTTGSTSAQAGDRYVEVARATGGVFESICNDSFADGLSGIGELAFATRWTYYLRHPVEEGTLIVTRNEVVCTDGFTFDRTHNSVTFDPGGPCAPADGDAITFKYDRVCLETTAGRSRGEGRRAPDTWAVARPVSSRTGPGYCPARRQNNDPLRSNPPSAPYGGTPAARGRGRAGMAVQHGTALLCAASRDDSGGR